MQPDFPWQVFDARELSHFDKRGLGHGFASLN
jgi:hypothetical protein